MSEKTTTQSRVMPFEFNGHTLQITLTDATRAGLGLPRHALLSGPGTPTAAH